MSLRDEMQAIYDGYGKLTPRLVAEVAKDAEAFPAIHSRLEWDDSKAGPLYRIEQARELIRKIKVSYQRPTARPQDGEVRKWYAVRAETADEYVYEPAEKVAADPFMRALVLRDMEREWKTLKQRYGHFKEFIDMVLGDLSEESA